MPAFCLGVSHGHNLAARVTSHVGVVVHFILIVMAESWKNNGFKTGFIYLVQQICFPIFDLDSKTNLIFANLV